jgi:hypothetical protein
VDPLPMSGGQGVASSNLAARPESVHLASDAQLWRICHEMDITVA